MQTPRVRLSTVCFAAAAVAIGYAIHTGNGFLNTRGIAALAGGIVLGAYGVRVQRSSTATLSAAAADLVLAAGVAFQLLELGRWPIQLAGSRLGWSTLSIAVLVATGWFAPGRWRWLVLVALLGAHGVIGTSVIRDAPDPRIDVVAFHRAGIDALLAGENPYLVDMPDVYGGAVPTTVARRPNGDLDLGFPYFPLPLIIGAPAQAWLGDYRYASLFAIELAAVLLFLLGRGARTALLFVTILLFTPRVFFVVEQGWNEPFAVLMLAAALLVLDRAPRFAFVPLGLLLASKQSLLAAIPLFALLRDRPGRAGWVHAARALGLSSVLAAGSILVVVAGAGARFFDSVFRFHHDQPWRADSLSFPAFLAHGATPGLPIWVGIALPVLGLVLVFARAPRGAAGFAAGLALALTIGFAFAPQAFANYYFLSIAGFVAAAAATPPPEPSDKIPVMR